MRRVPLYEIESLTDLCLLDLDLARVILDIDNTLLPYRATRADVDRALLMLVQLRAKLPADAVLTLISNGRGQRAAVADLVSECGHPSILRAMKPYRHRPVAELHPTVVVGDQVCTDGLLAWRLGLPFVRVEGCSLTEPPWPRLMRAGGRRISLGFFRCT